jgi:hypothetical protein
VVRNLSNRIRFSWGFPVSPNFGSGNEKSKKRNKEVGHRPTGTLVTETYEIIRPYWEAWKSDDPADLRLRDEFVEICKGLAGDYTAKAPTDTLDAAKELRAESLEFLKSLPNFDPCSNTITLYRGIADDGANQLRRAKSTEWGYPISRSAKCADQLFN